VVNLRVQLFEESGGFVLGGYLDGKVAVVTGAGRGIGRAIALMLADQGARVVVADYGGAVDARKAGTSDAAEEVVREITAAGYQAVPSAEDISTLEGGQRVVQAALDHFGRLDAMVCCAGIMVQRYLWELSESDWDDVIAVHLKGHFSCARAAAEVMMPQGSGRLVFFSSGAFAGVPIQPSYATAKAGILGFTWSTAAALASYGITTNCVIPSAATRMSDKTFSEFLPLSDEPGELVRSDLAGGTPRDPANIAPLVAYLLTDAASNINGQIFRAVGYEIARMSEIDFSRVMTSEGPWDLESLLERLPKELGPDLSRKPLPWPPPTGR
jgi:NAD(P)-dependent dehydrogenase (short-subunit alcohol dehydrogenase family)